MPCDLTFLIMNLFNFLNVCEEIKSRPTGSNPKYTTY